ncbi:cytochrome P450 716B1 [Physcomitrium patens]|uniref:Cytochrome P450 n=1 Tax=Physcomitrium patens TaxID=3218 RepID=A0A2K1II26_PHYPA|nr:cytochrome P450 716B1-like [Physcomitrium patens]PNR28932.1 hypothetical protein PHYPA_027624 [Physcomitrium patens]|eukprot:XP_024362776.1 cytochrome P450 716B1-like [Physcomitrella patens]
MAHQQHGFLEGHAESTPAWAAVAAVVAMLVGWLFWRLFSVSPESQGKLPVPPGSFKWPLLGETLDYLDCARRNRVADFFNARVAKYGETFKTHILFNPTVSVAAPDGNKFLFANENKLVQNHWPPSVSRLLGEHSMATKVGEEHRRARRVYTNFFKPEGLQSFVPRIDELARSHNSKYWEGKEFILGGPTVRDFTFAVAADLFLSLKHDDPMFRPFELAACDYLAGILQVPINLPGTAYRKGILGRESQLRVIDMSLKQRRQEMKEGRVPPQQDLMSVLLNTLNEDGTPMSDDQIKDNMLLFVFAGHDTSSSALAGLLKYLSLNPECLKKVLEEQMEIRKEKGGEDIPLSWDDTRKMKYTWRTIQETLRLQPSVQAAFRTVIEEFEYDGYTIPKGWTIFWSVGRSHRNPKFFPDPEKFDPSRFEGTGPAPFTFVPFGGGPHICPGNEFARTEILVYIHYLVLNYEWEMVDPTEDVCIDPMPLFTKQLQLRVRKRFPSL